MRVVERIIDLNTVAMIGGTTLEVYYATSDEWRELTERTDLEKELGVEHWFKGCIDGVRIVPKEAA